LRHRQPSLWEGWFAEEVAELWEPWMQVVDQLSDGGSVQYSTNPLRTAAAFPEAIGFLGAVRCVAGVYE
jgi:hypothetical protein